MEYIFGSVYRKGAMRMNLKTVGKVHTELTGYCTYQREDSDRREEHRFLVTEHYLMAEDIEGRCYDWYIIEQYSKDTDRFTPVKEEIETNIIDTQDALCETSADFDQRIADIEDALCELTEE